ncbi:hypothetical protein EI555_014495, partial [Monodon monoceros]
FLIFKRKIHEDLAFLKNRQDSRSGKQQTFHELTYCGLDLDPTAGHILGAAKAASWRARQWRRPHRRLRRKQHWLPKRLRKVRYAAPPKEKPEPNVTGSMVGVYNGKTFNQVEIKPAMIGHYRGKFSIT